MGLAVLAGSEAGQAQDCTQLLQAGDAKAVAACKAQLDEAESGPASERMARIVADDEYGVALLAVAHQPKQSLDPFDREIALLPASTVKPDSLEWAVAFWHRATAYQQLEQWDHAARRSADSGGYIHQRDGCSRRGCGPDRALPATPPAGARAACGCAQATGQARRSRKNS